MSTNDRGMKKWVTMMLPEHKEILKDMSTKKDKPKRLQVDEQLLEQYSHRLTVAYDHQVPVRVTYYTDQTEDVSSTQSRKGLIMNVDSVLKKIHIDHLWISIDLIIDIEFVSELNE